MDLRTALAQGKSLLEEGGIAAPRLTAEVLLAFATGKIRQYFYAHPEEELTELGWIHYGRYLHQRLSHKPTQYITRRQEFWGRDFLLTPDVLIPRPETEHMIETVLAECADARRIVDVGTGSGAIAVTLALEMNAQLVATDISAAALLVARGNAARLKANVSFVNCNLTEALGAASVDALVSNPPYVPEADRPGLEPEVRDWEPPQALFAGVDGLALYPALIAEAARVVRPGGCFVAEMGIGQSGALLRMLAGWNHVHVIKDLAGIDRIIAATRPV